MGTVSRWEHYLRFPEQQYHRRIFDLTEGAVTPNSFVSWLHPSRVAVPLAPPTPQPRKRGRRQSAKEAPDANQPAEATTA